MSTPVYSTPHSAPHSATYRPEIQGLRAVAAILVAIYHIWLGRVSGGVDVFFAISAFLITRSLLRQAETSGRIDFVAFWGRLARRLLPAAAFVLLVVSVASMLWLPRTLWQATIQQVFASLLYVENWRLAFDAVDYLTQGQSASPVQHYWALSIQGQIYVLWPCLFVTALVLKKKIRVPLRPTLLGFLAALFMLSFIYSIIATRGNQAFAYFSTLTRLWEFSLGASIALLPSLPIPRWQKIVGGWIGLCGIVICGLVLQVSQVFPGYAALWPVGCALLIVLAGTTGSPLGADRLLAKPLLVFLGNASYGIYLWHWPVLIFYRWFTDHRPIGLAGGSAIIAVSVGLALLTMRFIESPLRAWHFEAKAPRRIVAFVAAVAAPVMLTAIGWGGYVIQQKQYDGRPLSAEDAAYPGAQAWNPLHSKSVISKVPAYPGMLAVVDDMPAIYKDGCYDPEPSWKRENCIYGDRDSQRTIALVGSSHSVQWLPALDVIAKKQGWRVIVHSKSNCVFSVEIDDIEQDRWCREWNERTLQNLIADPPQVVLTISTRGSGPDEHVPKGFLLRWNQLEEAGMKVMAIRDTPWMKFWIPECLEMKGMDSTACSQPTAKMLKTPPPVELVRGEAEQVHFIDLSEYFCDAKQCPPVIGNIVVYRDDSHVTPAYARSLAPMLLEKLASGLPPGWMEPHTAGAAE